MFEPQPPQLPPIDPDRLEALDRLKSPFLACLAEVLRIVHAHGLDPRDPESRSAIDNLTASTSLVLNTGGDAWGLPARGQMLVIDEDISMDDLKGLAGEEADDPITLPPSVLRSLLKLQGTAVTETPATVDVFVDHVKCKPAPGRTQAAHRWLTAELPGGKVVEVLVKPQRESGS